MISRVLSPFEISLNQKWLNSKITVDQNLLKWTAGKIASDPTYKLLGAQLNIPFYFIGVIHYRESSFNFKTHLYNGDSLNFRTVHEPSGFPKIGDPPFTWVESATDCLRSRNLQNMPQPWDVLQTLDRCERYNGLGYRNRNSPSPYLWSGTDQYITGKYGSDGKFNLKIIDKQVGCAALLKCLQDSFNIDLNEVTPI